MPRLGCGTYDVLIHRTGDEGTRGPLIERFENVTSVRWARQANRITQGRFAVAGDCCGPFSEWTRTAACDPGEVTLVRQPDNEEVHVGPVVSPIFGDETIEVNWADLLHWTTQRSLAPYDFTGAPLDLAQVLVAGYEAAFTDADPATAQFLSGYNTGTLIEPATGAYQILWEQIQTLIREGLDIFAIGREIRYGTDELSDEFRTQPVLPKLDESHFIGGEILFRRRWDLAAQRVIVQGQDGVLAIAEDGACGSNTGKDLILTEPTLNQSEAEALAAEQLERRKVAPLTLQMPSGTFLSPDAPVCIADLVPGAFVPICVEGSCFEGTQLMQLQNINVSLSGGQDEQVRLSFATPGAGGLNLFTDDDLGAIGRNIRQLQRDNEQLRRALVG